MKEHDPNIDQGGEAPSLTDGSGAYLRYTKPKQEKDIMAPVVDLGLLRQGLSNRRKAPPRSAKQGSPQLTPRWQRIFAANPEGHLCLAQAIKDIMTVHVSKDTGWVPPAYDPRPFMPPNAEVGLVDNEVFDQLVWCTNSSTIYVLPDHLRAKLQELREEKKQAFLASIGHLPGSWKYRKYFEGNDDLYGEDKQGPFYKDLQVVLAASAVIDKILEKLPSCTILKKQSSLFPIELSDDQTVAVNQGMIDARNYVGKTVWEAMNTDQRRDLGQG
jgi:hypothetical protein